MNYVIVLIQAANPAWEDIFLLLPHDWDNGGGHKPLNSAADELRACPVIPSARDREVRGLLAAEPAFAFAGTRNRFVADKPDGTNLRPANTEGGLLLQSERPKTYCAAIHSERKSRAFLICNLVFGKSGKPQIVCGAANL